MLSFQHIFDKDSVKEIVGEIGSGKSFQDIINNLNSMLTFFLIMHEINTVSLALPDTIHRTYIDQGNYWLTFFPYDFHFNMIECILILLILDYVDSLPSLIWLRSSISSLFGLRLCKLISIQTMYLFN